MIRLLIVDDHPAMRAGLKAVLEAEPGIVPLGAASSAEDLPPVMRRTRPDVVLLDYHLPGTDGLKVCRSIKRMLPAPKVLLYSAWADADLAVPALLAGADGILNKSVPAPELYEAIRTIGRGDKVLPPLTVELREQAMNKLEPEDGPILSMMLEGTSQSDVADTLKLTAQELTLRLDAMIGRLRVEVPADAV